MMKGVAGVWSNKGRVTPDSSAPVMAARANKLSAVGRPRVPGRWTGEQRANVTSPRAGQLVNNKNPPPPVSIAGSNMASCASVGWVSVVWGREEGEEKVRFTKCHVLLRFGVFLWFYYAQDEAKSSLANT